MLAKKCKSNFVCFVPQFSTKITRLHAALDRAEISHIDGVCARERECVRVREIV